MSLRDVVLEFAINAERVNILKGFLGYRSALHAAGLIDGFQWLDGSFFEYIEVLDGRAPNDIDVVTFFNMPPGMTQLALVQAAEPGLFGLSRVEKSDLKHKYSVDAFLVSLRMAPTALVQQSAYWYSVWSHRRDFSWKGYVEVDLAPTEDAAVLAELLALPPQPPAPVRPVAGVALATPLVQGQP